MAAALAVGFIQAQTGSAASATWSGATDNNWNTATNWTGGAAPNATTDDATFNTPGAANLNVNANSGAISLRSLTFNADATSPVNINIAGGSFTIAGQTGDDVVVQAGHHVIQGTTGAVTSAELRIGAGGGAAEGFTFNIADGASLELNAHIAAQSSSNHYYKTGAGTLQIDLDQSTPSWNFGSGGWRIDQGYLVLTDRKTSGNTGDDFTVNNGGTLQFSFGGGGSYNSTAGLITLNDGGTLKVTSNGNNMGFRAGGAVDLHGTPAIEITTDNSFSVSIPFTGDGVLNKTGGGTLVLADTSTAPNTFTGAVNIAAGTLANSASSTTGNSPLITIQSGAAYNVSANGNAIQANQTLAGNGTVYGSLTLQNSGSTIAPGGLGTVGTLNFGDATTASPLTLNGGRVLLDLSNTNTATANDSLVVNGDLNLNSATRVAINRLNGALQGGGTYTLMTYTGALNGSVSNLVLPVVRQGLTIVDPTLTPGQIQLSVGTGTAANLVWVGDNSANAWEANGAANWNGAADHKYFDWDNVTFDDTGSKSPAISVNGTLVPNSITLNNATGNYTIGGGGTLTNVNNVTKNGGAAATFNNTGVNLFNNLTVNAGTLNIASATIGIGTVNAGALNVLNAATITGSLTNAGTITIGDGSTGGAGSISGNVTNNGTLVFNRPDDFASNTAISGSGTVVKTGNGTATLSGNSSYTGPTLINAGTVKPAISASLGATTGGGSVTVANGAAIDLGNSGAANSVNFGDKVFHIQGTGVGGTGAITNSGNNSQFSAFNNITLDGDALIGGMRMDIGRNVVGQLDLAGHKLTLNMTNNASGTQPVFGIENNVTVTAGTIEVTAGAIDFERSATVHADGAGSNIIFDNNTVAQFFETTAGAVSRPLVFLGNNVIGPGSNNGAIVDSPMELRGNVTFQTVSSGVANTNGTGTFTVNGPITQSGGSFGVTKVNGNQVVLNGTNTYTGGNTVNAGTLLTNTNFSNGTLTINGGNAKVAAQPTNNSAAGRTVVPAVQVNAGSIDLTNNAMVVDYAPGSSPRDTVRGYLNSGYAGGAWTGNGIASSSAATASSTNAKTGIGYAEASVVPSAVPAGFTDKDGDNSSLILKYALLGDSNLDGTVNALDFNALASNYGASGSGVWTAGDFNYDGNVETTDFNLLAQNFNQVLASSAPALGTLVPEPATALLGVIGGLGILSRRRRAR